MSRNPTPALAAAALLLAGGTLPGAEVRVHEGTNIGVDIRPGGGRLAMDLLGDIWLLRETGGVARQLTDLLLPAHRPRWSPDGSEILYQTDGAGGSALWRVSVANGATERLSEPGLSERHGDWHPGGERIIFGAAAAGQSIDLWERDLATGLRWRLTQHPGNESEPAWSGDGRHLLYVLHQNGEWQLMLRPFGLPARALVSSPRPLAAPSWRPDNTLVTYLARNEAGAYDLWMLILAETPLPRVLASGEDFFHAPVTWRDRHRLYYAADGIIKGRDFEDRNAREVPFLAAVTRLEPPSARNRRPADLPAAPAGNGRLVVRAPRLYDGLEPDYRYDVDIVIEDGLITGIVAGSDRTGYGDVPVFDIGNVTVIPGLIDAYARLPAGDPARFGPLLLASGVTTVVATDTPADFAPGDWQTEATPGPLLLRAVGARSDPAGFDAGRVRLVTTAAFGIEDRQPGSAGDGPGSFLPDWRDRGVPVLADNWDTGLGVSAELLLGTASLPRSPLGRYYEDIERLANGGPLLLVSGLADAATPGLAELATFDTWSLLEAGRGLARRLVTAPPLAGRGDTIVLGSHPSGLPAGPGTQAELRALQAAGLEPAAALHAATGNAARVLGVAAQIGSIEPGARADLLLIAGDPLADAGDAAQVVAVVANGRFYSVSNLLERATAGVE
ncbi:MAG: amidohydrolase family protein [Woeseiaceae bacterium]|nr:amidohydrolase family protein [Woeseiaceae bacterium]